MDGTVQKIYRTTTKDCKVCPMKSTCVPNESLRQITRTVFDEQYLRAYSRQHSKRGKQMKKLRQSTVEPVFGSLTHYYGLRKIGVLGQAGAHKVMLMAAIAFNLKKYLKKGGRKPSCTFFKAIIDILNQYLLTFSRNQLISTNSPNC
nr:transposase [Pedobacter sp.]QJS06199.1 transposase, IS1182 family [Pedobacter sp.]